MNKMFLAALLAISGGSIATADTLIGRVADSEGNPVEFATVVALSANHEQGGAVTDSIGNYRIELPKGQYIVTFTLVGYDNAEKTVTVSGETRLDTTMTTNAVALHGVEVKASAIRRLPDRFVVRVEDMPAAIGKDGKELLQAAPGRQENHHQRQVGRESYGQRPRAAHGPITAAHLSALAQGGGREQNRGNPPGRSGIQRRHRRRNHQNHS